MDELSTLEKFRLAIKWYVNRSGGNNLFSFCNKSFEISCPSICFIRKIINSKMESIVKIYIQSSMKNSSANVTELYIYGVSPSPAFQKVGK